MNYYFLTFSRGPIYSGFIGLFYVKTYPAPSKASIVFRLKMRIRHWVSYWLKSYRGESGLCMSVSSRHGTKKFLLENKKTDLEPNLLLCDEWREDKKAFKFLLQLLWVIVNFLRDDDIILPTIIFGGPGIIIRNNYDTYLWTDTESMATYLMLHWCRRFNIKTNIFFPKLYVFHSQTYDQHKIFFIFLISIIKIFLS